MWLKLFLLTTYILLLLLLSRVLEALSWCEVGGWGYGGQWSRQLLDPMALSVAKLKALLEHRGVSYDHVVEKSELSSLVTASGQLSTAEIEQTALKEETMDQTNFTSGGHFIEQVEDAKDSVWLVQIVFNSDQLRIVGDARWKGITQKLSKFGVRTGVLDCSLDLRFCDRKHWRSPFLLLAMPSQFQKKASIAMYNYAGPVREAVVMRWLRDHLSERMEYIDDPAIFQTKWKNFSKSPFQPEVHAVLFSQTSRPPLFYSALSVKFPGRVKFGIVNLNSHATKLGMWKRVLQKDDIQKLPSYLIYTSEGSYVYGQIAGEYLSFFSMERFLRFLYPCLNDIFIISFISANVMSLFEPVISNCGIITRIGKWIWCTIKYNIIVIMLWLPIIGLFQMPYLDKVPLGILKLERLFSLSHFGSVIRGDYAFFIDRPIFVYVSFILYLIVVTVLCNKYREREDERDGWFNYSNMTSLTHPSPNNFISPARTGGNDFIRGLEIFGSRLTQPSLWFHPTVSSDYIQYLPTWRYTPISIAELAAKNAAIMHSKLSATSETTTSDQLPSSKNKDDDNECPSCSCNDSISSKPKSMRRKPGDSVVNTSSETSQSPQHKSHDLPPSLCSHNPSLIASSSSHTVSQQTHQSCTEIQTNTSHFVDQTKLNTQSDFKNDPLMSKETCTKCTKPTSPVNDGMAVTTQNTTAPTQHGGNPHCEAAESSHQHSSSTDSANGNPHQPTTPSVRQSGFPPGCIESHQCAICLEDYLPLTMLCGLPCGHVFHETCIFSWLNREKHFCPMCRWPSYKLPEPSA